MLALEGELAASLPQASHLALTLGTRVGVSKATVMQRYKAIYDLIEEYIRDVPWLESHERKGKGRSKVAKRVVVARGLKDVVQFQEEIWKKKLEGQQKLMLDIEVESNDGNDSESIAMSEHSDGMSVMPNQRIASREDDSAPQPKKVRKSAYERAVEQTSRFLLHPLAKSSDESADKENPSGLLEHFFTADESSLSHVFTRPPTRLQLLIASRGENSIDDTELFDEGELESFMRTPDEVDVLKQTLAHDWDVPDDKDPRPGSPLCSRGKRKRGDEAVASSDSPSKRTKRVNMDALARLLDPETHLDEVEEEGGLDALDWGLGLHDDEEGSGVPMPYEYAHADGEEIERWRPLSPGGAQFDEDRYDA